MNVGDIECYGQAPRESVEVAQVDFALPRHLQLPLEAGCELAHRHRHEDEEDQVDDLLRILDVEAVERWIEEKGGGEHAANCGDDRRYDSPARGCDHDRNQKNDG